MIKILDKYKIVEILEDNNSTIICNSINIETDEKTILKLFDKDIYDEGDFNKLEENINSSNINKNSNLMKVYDVGMYSYNNTTYYAIALEYINGESLNSIVEYGTFDEEQGLEIVKQIISGLSELHNIGIIYRNLTSKNIYLDTKGLIKLDTTGYISTKTEKQNTVDESTDIYLLGTLFYKIMTKETINIDDRPSYIDKEKFSTLAVSILEKSIYQDILHRYKSLNEFLMDIKLENNYILGNFKENSKQEQKIVKSKKKYIKYIVGCIVLGIVFISAKALGNKSVNKVEEKNEQTLVLNDEDKIENDIKETIKEENISEELTLNDNKESLNSNQIIQSTSTSNSNNQNRPGSNSLGSTSSNKKPSSNSNSTNTQNKPNSNNQNRPGSNSLGSTSSNKKPSSNSNSTNTQNKPSSGGSSSTESNSGSNSGDNNESDSESNLEQIKPEETPEEAPDQKPEQIPEETPSETPEQNEGQDSQEMSE